MEEQSFKSIRDGFGEAILELARTNRDIVVLSADLAPSLKVDTVRNMMSGQFIECGVAEQNMVGVAAGLALSGKIPFATSFSEFLIGRAWEQIRIDVCYNNVNVKLIGSHGGLSTGEDGATHQILEDLALTRTLPNMTVISPCDIFEAYKATIEASKIIGPVYIRIARPKTLVLTNSDSQFMVGKINILREGKDIVIFGTGPILGEAIMATEEIKEKSIAILNVHTIKPIEKEIVIRFAKEAKLVLTLEDHQVIGGLGSAIAEILAENSISVPLKRLGVNDQFGESGDYRDLWKKYGMDKDSIVKIIKEN
ncbi:MAG: transketolase C-terminal domain-containing protein [Candidatus Paceibacterota bacterium]|jgi:transketolase